MTSLRPDKRIAATLCTESVTASMSRTSCQSACTARSQATFSEEGEMLNYEPGRSNPHIVPNRQALT